MTSLYATDVISLSEERRWNRARLIHEMRLADRTLRHPIGLPDDPNLRRMLRLWNSGVRGLSTEYAALFTALFGVPFLTGKPPASKASKADASDDAVGNNADDGTPDELATRLALAATVDAELVALFEHQTDSYRHLDRRL